MIEYLDKINEKDEVIDKIPEERQNFIKPSQLRFVKIIIADDENKIIVTKRSSNRKIFPNCYDFSVGGHVNSGESYNEAAYRELKEELGISNVKLKEIVYFSPFESKSNTFQKVYFLRYNRDITNYDKNGIDRIYYMSIEEIKQLMIKRPDSFKTDYFVVIDYVVRKKLL